MMGFKGLLFICCVYFSFSLKVSGQINVYQENFYGGINVVGVASWGTTSISLNDFGSSPVKKAFFISGNQNDNLIQDAEYPLTVNINSISYTLNDASQRTGRFDAFYLQYSGSVHIIDVTESITATNFNITIPVQTFPLGENPNPRFYGMSLVVLYENPTLDNVCFSLWLNNQKIDYEINHLYNNLMPVNTINETAISFSMSHMLSTNPDGSYVSLNSNSLGLIGGSLEYNVGGEGSILGQFTYSNGTIQAIGNDDTNDSLMDNSDVLANITSYISSGANSIPLKLQYFNGLANENAISSNPIWATFLAYTSPCDTFSVTVPNDTTVCEGTQLQLNASTTNPTATYEWSTSTGSATTVPGLSCSDCPNPIFTADSSMFYTVRIWNNDSCSVVRPIKINVRPRPAFGVITSTASECGASTGSVSTGSTTALNELYVVDSNGTVFSSVSQNQSSATIGNLGAGNYTVYFIDTNGCQSADSIVFIDEVNSTVANFTVNPTSGAAPLDVSFTNTSQNATNYTWSVNGNNEGNNLSNYIFDPSGTYVVTLVAWQNDPSCADTTYKTIFVYDSLLVEIPNVFTPNGDGVNDFFSINTNMPINCHLVIVNRWGNVMQEFNGDIPAGTTKLWDASTGSAPTINGSNASEGVYFYTLRFDASSETPEGVKFLLPAEKEGFVTLAK